jgi:hypothetical protein
MIPFILFLILSWISKKNSDRRVKVTYNSKHGLLRPFHQHDGTSKDLESSRLEIYSISDVKDWRKGGNRLDFKKFQPRHNRDLRLSGPFVSRSLDPYYCYAQSGLRGQIDFGSLDSVDTFCTKKSGRIGGGDRDVNDRRTSRLMIDRAMSLPPSVIDF